MHFTSFLPLAFVSAAHASFDCLLWDLASPLLGTVCTFKPELFDNVENKVVTGVEDIVHGVENTAYNVGKFDLTHNPAYLVYDYISVAESDGLAAANSEIKSKANDFKKVTIGFGKEGVNTAVTIVEWTNFGDLWYCIYSGIFNGQVLQQAQSQQIHIFGMPQITNDSVASVVEHCTGKKMHDMTHPMIFNVTDNDEQIGSDLFDVAAALLVPAGAGGKVGELVTKEGFDAVVAGVEDSSRIVEWAPEEGEAVGRPFKSKADVDNLITKMQEDPDWPSDNCIVCTNPYLGLGSERRRLKPRGAGPSRFLMCCRAPVADVEQVAVDGQQVADDELIENLQPDSPAEGTEYSVEQTYSNLDEQVPPGWQTTFRSAPDYPILDYKLLDEPGVSTSAADLISDFKKYETARLGWGSDLIAVKDSTTLFNEMRTMFQEGSGNSLWQKLQVKSGPGGSAKVDSIFWLDGNLDPDLQVYKDFHRRLDNWACRITGDIAGTYTTDYPYATRMEIFWDPASARTNLPVDFKVDNSFFAFETSDEPALHIMDTHHEAVAVNPRPNTFQVLAGQKIGGQSPSYQWIGPVRPTWHRISNQVIGPNGRVRLRLTTLKPLDYQRVSNALRLQDLADSI